MIYLMKAFEKKYSCLFDSKLLHTSSPEQIVDDIFLVYRNTYVNVKLNNLEKNIRGLMGNGTR